MRIRYKLGQLVLFNSGHDQDTKETTGTIDAIVIRSKGISYRMNNLLSEVEEAQIVQAYKPIGKPVGRLRKKRASKLNGTKEVQESLLPDA